MGERTAAFHLKAAPTPATVPVTVLPPPHSSLPSGGLMAPDTARDHSKKTDIY